MVTYANTKCINCDAVHPPVDWINESPATKRVLMEIVFQMSVIFNRQHGGRARPAAAPLSTAEVNRPVMVGVLIAGGLTFVAQSGGPHPLFIEALRRVQLTRGGLTLAGAVPVGGVTTRGGTPIPQFNISACQAAAAPAPLSCAAPKLIHAANLMVPPGTAYTMSEVFYDARSEERATVVTATQSEALIYARHSGHGRSQVSCPTCENVVPYLMCPN